MEVPGSRTLWMGFERILGFKSFCISKAFGELLHWSAIRLFGFILFGILGV